MKKILTWLVFILSLFQSKAQNATTINPFESVIIEMVCDCNPSQVLNTFVTNADGVVNIKVPKDANYSFKLVMPPVLKEKGIKMADLASDVIVNFTGAKNAENIAFNNKGIASAKNLQQGNYEMALTNKPPKEPNGQSGKPKGKCPPGEIPWLGGCIPSVVVKGLNKVGCPVGTKMTQFGCMDVKNPGKEPEIPRPDGFPSPNKAVAINCPSGKYDANGNCIFASPNTTDNKSKMFSVFSVDAGYLGSANANNNKDSKPLFAGSGVSAGLNYRYGAKWGIAGRIGYAGGSLSESNLNEFASTLTKAPWVYKITGFTKSWSQVNFAVGPSIFFGKNYKGEISVIGGVSMGSESKLKIDLYDANTFYKNVYDVTEKKVKAYWEVGGSYRVAKIANNILILLKASYGANGGFVGIKIERRGSSCCGGGGCYCMRGCPEWMACLPKADTPKK